MRECRPANDQTPERTPAAYRRWRRRMWAWGLLGLIAVVFLGMLVRGLFSFGSVAAARIKCGSNFRMIGLAIQMYSNEHQGRLPDSFEELLASTDITPEDFLCPAANETRAAGPTTQAVLDQFAAPGHCSYIYLGKGLTWNNDPQVVLAYEPNLAHGETRIGMNVLSGDGHVDFIRAPGVLPWIAAAKGGPVVRPR